jgi:toxin ParE1/3/4
MLELRLRPQAQTDLDEIWDYTAAKWSATQANRYVAELRHSIEQLRKNPNLGRPTDHPASILKRANGSHIIFYRVETSVLDVVRVLHAQMDFAAHLPANET